MSEKKRAAEKHMQQSMVMKKLAVKSMALETMLTSAVADLPRDQALFVLTQALAGWAIEHKQAGEIIPQLNYALGTQELVAEIYNESKKNKGKTS